MHHQSLWKGITVFSLALGIGTFTSDFYEVKEISENVFNQVKSVEKKNCRFADPNLMYQTLHFKNEKYSAEMLSDPKKIPFSTSKSKEKKTDAKEPQNDVDEKLNKPMSELNIRPEIKSKEEYSTLLHMEICSESDGRK